MLERHARRVIRRRWWVVAAWIVPLAIGLMLAPRIGDVTSNQVTLPGKESQRGIDLIEQKFGNGESSSLQVVYRNPNATVDDASYREPVTAGWRRAAAIVPGTQVIDYYSSGSSDLVGDDGHLTYATSRMPISPRTARTRSCRSGRPWARPRLREDAGRRPGGLRPRHGADLRRRPQEGRGHRLPARPSDPADRVRDRGERPPAHRRGRGDHRHGARHDVPGGPGHDAGRLRDQRDHADRHRHRHRLLAADGLAVPGGAEGWARPRCSGRADDGHGRSLRDLLGHHGGHRPRRPGVPERAVHPLDGHRHARADLRGPGGPDAPARAAVPPGPAGQRVARALLRQARERTDVGGAGRAWPAGSWTTPRRCSP